MLSGSTPKCWKKWVLSRMRSRAASLFGTHPASPQVRDRASVRARIAKQFTGVFLDNAQYLVPIPPPTQKDLEKQFNLVVTDALSHGLTSIHDAGFDPKSLEFYKGSAVVLFYVVYLLTPPGSFSDPWFICWPVAHLLILVASLVWQTRTSFPWAPFTNLLNALN
jgi:hypothetical protein